MAEVELRTQSGKVVGKATLPEETFGIEPNVAVMHQVVTAQLAAARSGTHSTRSRSEARGGGAKPWRQKGTGRARAGSIRSPIWVGGGRSHGPKPRDYAQRTPKKMKKLALRSALSDRVLTGGLVVVDEWKLDRPRTRDAIEVAEALGVAERSLLVVASGDEEAVDRSFRNLPDVTVIRPNEINTYDVIRHDFLLVGLETLKVFAGGEISVTKTRPRKESAANGAAAAKKAPKAGKDADGAETVGDEGEIGNVADEDGDGAETAGDESEGGERE